ncbi:MAG: RIP metalloprotease RseP [Candidatus Bipolaricaulota bacterium]
MMTLLIFLGFILVLVGVHEGGHFLMAKLTGIAVEEFALGFGPPIWSRKRGETRYSVRLLPLGGFVRLAGETESAGQMPLERTYYGRPAWARLALSAAGPAANVLLALAVLMVAVWSVGVPGIRVAGLFPDAPAQEALQVGDQILRIDGRRIWLPEDLGPAIQQAAPGEVSFELLRDGERLTVEVTPQYSEQDELYRVGSYFAPQVLLTKLTALPPNAPLAKAGLQEGDRIVAACERGIDSAQEFASAWEQGCREISVQRNGELLSFTLHEQELAELVAGAEFERLPLAHRRAGIDGIRLSFRLLTQALTDFVHGIRLMVAGEVRAEDAIAGPVGIAGILSEGVQAGAWPSLILVALLSLNLAIINVLPFPALDGARMVFSLWELVTRRKVSPVVENAVHTVGFIILLAVLLLITFWDVLRLFE